MTTVTAILPSHLTLQSLQNLPNAPITSQHGNNKAIHYGPQASIYLLLTEFEVCTASYGPSFFPFTYGSSAKRTDYKSRGKKLGSLTYSTDQENEVSKISIISLRLIRHAGQETLKLAGCTVELNTAHKIDQSQHAY